MADKSQLLIRYELSSGHHVVKKIIKASASLSGGSFIIYVTHFS
jgi:hypothetical protein